MSSKLIYWLDELDKEHGNLVGKKCANLGELTRAGFQVPPGFALSLEAYEIFLKNTSAIDEIHNYFTTFKADPSDPKGLSKYTEASKFIRNIVESKTIPKDIEDSIGQYYEELCKKANTKDALVATRSAGPASHPGQYESYLNIAGKSDVIKNVIKVWSSTFNTRSLIARARKGLPLDYDPIGVCVLKMVNAKSAGIMFTAEPTTADTSKIVIEGSWGYGESVVSGAVIPDCWVVDKTKFEITECRISPKPAEYEPPPETGKTSASDITNNKQKACLNNEEVIELAKIGEKIEQHFGSPQDIEWAIDRNLTADNIFILQTRPENFRISFAGF